MKLFNFLVFIDDDHATNYYHEHVLNEYNICDRYIFFSSAEKALIYFKEHQNSPDFVAPDLIFSDINMPKIDGWSFLERYGEFKNSNKSLIYMLTTSSNLADIEKISRYPLVSGYKEKPLSQEMLIGISEGLK